MKKKEKKYEEATERSIKGAKSIFEKKNFSNLEKFKHHLGIRKEDENHDEELNKMSGKTVFDHLSEQIDSVVRGRRYIIAEIGKLKVTLEEFREAIEEQAGGGGGGIASIAGEMKNFMQNTISTLSELKGTISQLSGTVNNLQTRVQQLSGQVQNVKSSGGAPQQQYSPPPQQQAPPPQQQAPQGSPLDALLNTAKSGATAKDLGVKIDELRSDLSKKNPLNPILFELSIEAGRLKSMGDKALDSNGISNLEQKITKWKSKS